MLLLLAGVVGSPEDLPEAEGLVPRCRCDGVAVGALRHVQDPGGVAPQLRHLRHAGVLPQAQLVLAEAMGAQQLLLVPTPLEGADLRVGVHAVEAGARLRVPELDAAVCRASAGGEEVALEGAPCQGLHCSAVLLQAVQVRGRGSAGHHLGIPQVQEVVVPPARKLLPRQRPLQPAHLLLVRAHLRDHMISDAHCHIRTENQIHISICYPAENECKERSEWMELTIVVEDGVIPAP